MLFWTLQITIISIILIFLVHHLILFFKRTLTVPKIKDLINAPAQKYENIYNTISSKDYTESLLPNGIKTDFPNENTSQMHDIKSMKDELKDFLKTKISEDSGTSSIASLDSYSDIGIGSGSSSSSYSSF